MLPKARAHMLKLGIVGANGQVGAELCLLLAQRKEIELIPICRSRSGSAFLRWHGIACRHGRVADPTDAARLLGDCDVVVNSSLAGGSPAEMRRAEDRIIHNIFAHSKVSARIIHFSTQSVYGDPRPNRWFRWRNAYGRAKLATERQVHREARRTRKPAHLLRLGHVCGRLQSITLTIRQEIREGTVVLPAQIRSSNCVHTSTIAGAIDQIVRGTTPPGTLDLMNTPRWTWQDVYEYEAGEIDSPLRVELVAPATVAGKRVIFSQVARLAGALAAQQPVRDMFAKIFTYVPDRMNAHAMAWWYAQRARTEIAALSVRAAPADHLSWVENGIRFFPAEVATRELLRSASALYRTADAAQAWPADLPDAQRTQLSDAQCEFDKPSGESC
jgi:dTDP-4-dehydrorhamnose reductase